MTNQYYVLVNKEQIGPFSLEEVKQKGLKPETLVSLKPGSLRRADSYPELQELFYPKINSDSPPMEEARPAVEVESPEDVETTEPIKGEEREQAKGSPFTILGKNVVDLPKTVPFSYKKYKSTIIGLTSFLILICGYQYCQCRKETIKIDNERKALNKTLEGYKTDQRVLQNDSVKITSDIIACDTTLPKFYPDTSSRVSEVAKLAKDTIRNLDSLKLIYNNRFRENQQKMNSNKHSQDSLRNRLNNL